VDLQDEASDDDDDLFYSMFAMAIGIVENGVSYGAAAKDGADDDL
jgi:hypothetical protein